MMLTLRPVHFLAPCLITLKQALTELTDQTRHATETRDMIANMDEDLRHDLERPGDDFDNLTRIFENPDQEDDPDDIDVQTSIHGMVNRNHGMRSIPRAMQAAWQNYSSRAKTREAAQLSINDLRKWVKNLNHRKVINAMQQRTMLVRSPEDTVEFHEEQDKMLVLCEAIYLDYLYIAGGTVGLSAIVGSNSGDLSIDLNFANKQLSTKHLDISFDPTGRCIFIGWIRNTMRVFLVLAPDVYFDEDEEHEKWKNTKTLTSMPTPLQRLMKAFISFALASLGTGIQHNSANHKQVSLSPGQPENLQVLGNLFQRGL